MCHHTLKGVVLLALVFWMLGNDRTLKGAVFNVPDIINSSFPSESASSTNQPAETPHQEEHNNLPSICLHLQILLFLLPQAFPGHYSYHLLPKHSSSLI